MTLELIGFTKRRKCEVGQRPWLEVHGKNKKQIQLIITYGLMKVHKVIIINYPGAKENILSSHVAKKLDLMLANDVTKLNNQTGKSK